MKNSFVLYTSYLNLTCLLSDEEMGVLFRSILLYEAGKEDLIQTMDDKTQVAFTYIQSFLDADTEKYEKVCEVRRNAGKLGGRPKKEGTLSEKQEKQMDSQKSKESKSTPDNDNDFENENDVEKEGVLTDTEENDGSIPDTAFDEFWALYPKKKSKGQARKTWEKLKPDRPTCEAIMKKLPELIASPEWCKEDGRFIPYPATWLAAEGWNDEAGTARETKPESKRNRFYDFDQRSYDNDELERWLLLRDSPGDAVAAGDT